MPYEIIGMEKGESLHSYEPCSIRTANLFFEVGRFGVAGQGCLSHSRPTQRPPSKKALLSEALNLRKIRNQQLRGSLEYSLRVRVRKFANF
jgi:hypothetical protein